MSALLLTNYYLVYRSFFAYAGLALLLSMLLFYFGNDSMLSMVALLVILLVSMPGLEVIKHEGKSGYDKYVLTLPVSRNQIVKSHYFFYFIVVVLGSGLSYGVFLVYNVVSSTPVDAIFTTVALGIFIVLFIGAVAYPLLYMLGAEKSDAILLGGAMGGLIVTFGLRNTVGYIAEQPLISNLNIDPTLTMAIAYTVLGVMIYILSFFIATFIYNRKEF
ncbi:ABC-2 transporter permease [Alteribacter aurantiacus]|uniref:ABC-2 transporter permease n=1 Tax=Alteribacter aurantiacus TaxID=254410 RepID=UPI000427FC83|nr:ABC-2 transporter permease [Alteribacter aurantiacus]